MIYNIFDTQEEAVEAQQLDYQKFSGLRVNNDSCVTNRWADVIEMPDGKWGYAAYPDSENVYSTIDYTPTNEEGI